MLTEKQRQLALLEMGVERTAPWRPHPALSHTVVRLTIDGTEQRVMLASPSARTIFLREQRRERREVRKEYRRNLDMKWTETEA